MRSGELPKARPNAAPGANPHRAFERRVREAHGLISAIATSVLRDASLAEDVSQEVFLQLWTAYTTADPPPSDEWIAMVTRRRAIDRVRRIETARHYERRCIEPPSSSTQDPATLSALHDEHRQLLSAMHRLSPSQREIIALAYFAGFTQVKIAQRLDIPLGTVKTRIRTGLMALRQALAEPSPAR